MCEYFGESEPPAFYDQRTRRARKPHVCDSCDGRIASGERYHLESFVGDRGDRPEAQKMCHACFEARQAFSEAHGEEIYPLPSYLPGALRECIREEPESSERWQPLLDAMAQRKAAVA